MIFQVVVLIFIVLNWNNVLAAVSSGLPQISLVYLGIEMILTGKSFLKFDCWSNKAFKNYEDLQTSKIISQVEPFLFLDKQVTIEEGQRIQWMKHVSTHHNKDEDNSNHNQNDTHQTSSKKFKLILSTTNLFANLETEIRIIYPTDNNKHLRFIIY